MTQTGINRQAVFWLVLTGLLFGSLLVANYLRTSSNAGSSFEEFGYVSISNPEPITAFRLENQDGEAVDHGLFDRWSLVFFGFTYCPAVCPTTLAVLDQVVGALEGE